MNKFENFIPKYEEVSFTQKIENNSKWYSELKEHMQRINKKITVSHQRTKFQIYLTSKKINKRNAMKNKLLTVKSNFTCEVSCLTSRIKQKNKGILRRVTSEHLISINDIKQNYPNELLGIIDPIGSFIINLNKEYIEDINSLLKLGFLQKISYENHMNVHKKSLITTLSNMSFKNRINEENDKKT